VGAVGSELARFCRKTGMLIGKNLRATAKNIYLFVMSVQTIVSFLISMLIFAAAKSIG
jgi:hypothetical protein